ncbi:MAG TPA: right-handed parallel beta-helix repeat-containing protein, partial [Nocardioidaceae bacterium]|nr:right-handed parallel beta-helix repeat-containing protein [Nocardioidaceae bacterium]
AGDGIRMAARDSGSVLDFALRELNGSGGGGLQFTGGAGIHAEGDGNASIGGTIAGVDVLNPDGHGLFLKHVAGVDVSALNVQGGGLHGINVVDSSSVKLGDVDVALPAEHGLRVVSSSDIQLDDSRFEQRTPAPAGQGEGSYPAFAAVWIRHLGGSKNVITDTTLRGSIGDQLYIHNGPCAVDTCPAPSPDDWMTANVRISGITTVDTAVDPYPEPTDEVDPPPGDALQVLASEGAEVGVDLGGASASHTDAPIRLSAKAGGTLTVTGGHQIVHEGAGDSLALTATGPDALLRMALKGLEISQIAPQDGAALQKHGLLVTASADGQVTPLHDDLDDTDPEGRCPPAERATSVEDSTVRAVGSEPAVSFVAHGTEDPSTEASTALEVDTSSLSATIDGDAGNSPAVEMLAEAQGTVEDSTLCGGVLTATAGEGDALMVQTVDGESTDDPSTPTIETTTREDLRGLEVIGTTVDSADGSGVVVVGSFRELTEVSNVVVHDVTVTRAGSLGMGFAYLADLVIRGSRVRNAGSHGLFVTDVTGSTTLDGSGGAAGGTPGDPTDNAHVSSSGHGIWVNNSECLAVTDYTVNGVGVDADGDPRAAFNITGSSLVDFRPADANPDDATDHSDESVAEWLERKGNGKPADAPWFTGTANPASCNPEGA